MVSKFHRMQALWLMVVLCQAPFTQSFSITGTAPYSATRRTRLQATRISLVETLSSYSANLAASRKNKSIDKRAYCRAAVSLAHFLQSAKLDEQQGVTEALSSALIPALQIAGDSNDYRLILQLIDAVSDLVGDQPLLEPRIFAHALERLALTSVNVNKIRRVWNRVEDGRMLVSPMGARELNAMLSASVGRDKLGAALEVYRQHVAIADSYGLNLLLKALINSLKDDQEPLGLDNVRPTLRYHQLTPLVSNACWQWNEALSLIDATIGENRTLLNNHGVSSLIQLNHRVQEVFSSHDSELVLRWLLELMKEYAIVPDAVTCTLLLSNLDHESALTLFRRMQQEKGGLSRPNEYAYSAIMSNFAKAKQYEQVQKLFNELKNEPYCEANNWVYNTFLQSMVHQTEERAFRRRRATKNVRKASRLLVHMAFEIYQQMVQGRNSRQNTTPDTVTFNTLLAIMAGVSRSLRPSDWKQLFVDYRLCLGGDDRLAAWSAAPVNSILELMIDQKISRDNKTYRHALQASSSNATVLRVLDLAARDVRCWKKQSTGVLNAALQSAADIGDIKLFSDALSVLCGVGAQPDAESTGHLVSVLACGNSTNSMPAFLRALYEGYPDPSTLELAGWHSDAHVTCFQPATLEQYGMAVMLCLRAEDFDSAHQLLQQMQAQKLQITPLICHEIARVYAMVALRGSGGKDKAKAAGQAASAFTIVKHLECPSLGLLSVTCKACAAARMFEETSILLKRAHRGVIAACEMKDVTPKEALNLRSLHRSVMKSCADAGNVTAALKVCTDIENLSRKLSSVTSRDESPTVGMQAPEWQSLIVAASKSGHWRACLSSLQFVRPFVEATNPLMASAGDGATQLKDYRRLGSMLNSAVQCLAVRSQYGWIVRVIDDWIEWSGRRPPKPAILAAIRALASRGRGSEANSLLTRCFSPPTSLEELDGRAYEISLSVSAITTLYYEGMYDEADEALLNALSEGFLPLNVQEQTVDGEPLLTVDLHGMNVAVAHSAVRIALQQSVHGSWNAAEVASKDILVVTGRGRKSSLQMRPVLRPEVQRMLMEEFYPPLNTLSVPGNLGALRVPAVDVQAWLQNQRQVKSAQMLSVAATIKSISSTDRLKSALMKMRQRDIASGDSDVSDDRQ